MPDLTRQALIALMNDGVAQYPDEKLYEAASLLTPEERPTAPVRIQPYKLSTTEARYDPAGKDIQLGRQGQAYRGPIHRLAAALAHEGIHSRGDADEPAAYQRQHDVAKRLGEKDKDYLQVLLDRAQGKPIVIGSR